ncbi:mechanosensitive ion channel domain-containing protein [Pseudodesulfovibrio sp. zrk46]|uniref:mechanosensitive ion channel family protein n=1 Tax=Pseudodesulfovibrio sp. zrk46 TaxID=2725288 RepID=UPI0014494D6E|nr:mechanosensitive ion channel domain-containing protein [Pseudodesulfovibrio sp. zrk46]QJB55305.1 mechanosensitive ion channel [Pseudodesulfovibrio sp. zrk46]
MDNSTWIGWLVRVLFSVLVLGALIIFFRWLKGSKGSWQELWQVLSGALRKQVVSIVMIASGCLLITLLMPLASLDPEVANNLLRLMGTVWVVVAAWGVTLASTIAVRVIQWKYDVNVADNLLARRMHTRIRVLQRIVVVIVWIGATAGILMQFDRFQTLGTTLMASAGIMSIILGISAQKTLGSMIAGVQIALSHPINLDDVVIVEGEWGRIEEITYTYVVVKIWDQRRLIVPVTYFLDNPFQNWTKKSADITGSIFLHVDYATPLDPLRDEARRLCEAAGALWDGKTCVLQVTEAGAEDMTIRVLAGSPDASSAWELRCKVREGLIAFIQNNYPDSLPKRRLVMAKQE